MPLSPAHLRELADRVEAEEAEARRELEQADTDSERRALRAELEELKAKHAALEAQLRTRANGGDPVPDPAVPDPAVPAPTPAPAKKTRPGRKHGMVYTNPETGLGEVYQGEDEPEQVELDDDEGEE